MSGLLREVTSCLDFGGLEQESPGSSVACSEYRPERTEQRIIASCHESHYDRSRPTLGSRDLKVPGPWHSLKDLPAAEVARHLLPLALIRSK